MISVNFIIRNGLWNGYPFWESLRSCLPFADEIVISDGYSIDGTEEALQHFRDRYGRKHRISIEHDRWYEGRRGEEIARISQQNHTRCKGDWVYYLQADEIVDPRNVDMIRRIGREHVYRSVSFPFHHYTLGWKRGEGYEHAIRMVRNTEDIGYNGDGWTFEGNIMPRMDAQFPIHHLGWVFPVNCALKSVNHARLYRDLEDYQESARLAVKRMQEDRPTDGYPKPENLGEVPELMERLFGMARYELPK